MLRQIKIKPKALKQLQSLEKLNQQRIITKIEYYASLPNPKDYAEVLVDFAYGTYRYRIGDYRVIVDFDDE